MKATNTLTIEANSPVLSGTFIMNEKKSMPFLKKIKKQHSEYVCSKTTSDKIEKLTVKISTQC